MTDSLILYISYETGSRLWNRKLCYSAFFFLGSGIVI